ncbi:MAG: aminotransferase class I/II-fold pyridoxal phosphate-dependent enzyme, partial [Gammaproteobacteria bacterium]|nr:aminotransferase class I/II-fold pyridoxal phosphate-dependent enzyme [Gammaproteobacteria bacterium]
MVVLEENAADIKSLYVIVVVNPNKSSGRIFSAETLLAWHQELLARGGWLVVDEAFMDVTPENSLAAYTGVPGLVVLRSLGKFFGLAGLRVGFVLAWAELLKSLQTRLGPWCIANPARWIAIQALHDTYWQDNMRMELSERSQCLKHLLVQAGLPVSGGTALFQWIQTSAAREIQHQLAQQGIWIRAFDQPASIRFGLPLDDVDWQRLQQALGCLDLRGVTDAA